MISVLALIGKIILYIILTILIVLLLLLSVVLFVPVRYKGKGSFNAYASPNFHCDLRLNWLFHFISIHFYTKEDEKIFLFRILGIKHSSYQKFFSSFKRKSPKTKRKKNLKDEHPKQNLEKENEGKSNIDVQAEKIDKSENDATTDKAEKNFSKDRKTATNQRKKKKFSLDQIKKLLKDGEDLKRRIKRFYKILTSDICKESFYVCKDRLLKLFKYILPNKAKIHIYFGFDDPSVTGNILAIHGILYALLSDIIILHPNFDEQMFYGDFKLKGRIRLCTLLYHLLRIYFDENCKKFYRIIKKEMEHGR